MRAPDEWTRLKTATGRMSLTLFGRSRKLHVKTGLSAGPRLAPLRDLGKSVPPGDEPQDFTLPIRQAIRKT